MCCRIAVFFQLLNEIKFRDKNLLQNRNIHIVIINSQTHLTHSEPTTTNLKYKPVNSNVWKSTNSIWPTFTFAFPVLNHYVLPQPIFQICNWLLIISCEACWQSCSVTVVSDCLLCVSDDADSMRTRLSGNSVFSLIVFITVTLHSNGTSHNSSEISYVEYHAYNSRETPYIQRQWNNITDCLSYALSHYQTSLSSLVFWSFF